MSRGLQIFRQTDVKKATIAVRDAGLEVQRVEIDRAGKIVIVTRGNAAQSDSLDEDVAALIG
jgi:hypothetical protein